MLKPGYLCAYTNDDSTTSIIVISARTHGHVNPTTYVEALTGHGEIETLRIDDLSKLSSGYPAFERGDEIAYIPQHAKGKYDHPDVEFGFVTSGPNAQGSYFCRFWDWNKSGGCSGPKLTGVRWLRSCHTFGKDHIAKVLEEIEGEES